MQNNATKQSWHNILYGVLFTVTYSAVGAQQVLEKPESYSRNWETPAKELVGAAAGYALSTVLPNDPNKMSLADIPLVASAGLGYDALYRLGKNCIEAYLEQVAEAQYSHLRISKKSLIQKVSKQIQSSRYTLSQFHHALRAALQLYVFYALVSGDYIGSYPLNQRDIMLCGGIMWLGIVYHLNELYESYRSGKMRNNRPVAKILDGATDALLAECFYNFCGINSTIDHIVSQGDTYYVILRRWTPEEWVFFRCLQAHADYDYITGAIQVLWNILQYGIKMREGKAIVEPVPQKPELSMLNILPQKPNSSSPALVLPKSSNASVRLDQAPSAPRALRPEWRDLAGSEEESSVVATQRVKVKTRRSPDAASNVATSSDASFEEPAPETALDRLRKVALERLETLSARKTVSVQEMNQEINAMLGIISNASRGDGGHNKGALVLNFGEGKKYRLTYETPHQQAGAHSNEYMHARKERLIDALRVCYLAGWDEDKIKAYMASNNIVSFYNVPHFLLYILWDRGESSDQ